MTIDLTKSASFLVKPYGIVLLTVALSFLAWICPPVGPLLKGFLHPEPLFSVGGIMVLTWYTAIVGTSVVFFSLGQKLRIGVDHFDRSAPLSNNTAYILITLVATVGIYTTTMFFSHTIGWQHTVSLIAQHQGNIFRKELEDHNAMRSVYSFRYCTILSGGVGIFRFIQRKGWFSFWTVLDLYNILLVLICSFYGSRITLVATVLFGCTLYAFNSPRVILPVFKTIVAVIILFLILSFLNDTRNGGYFKKNGDQNLSEANASEIISYLGAPFQTSLAVGNKYEDAVRGEFYVQLADLSDTLTANSAFYALVNAIGSWAWPAIVLIVGASSFLMGTLIHHKRNYLILAYLGFFYGYAELWRLFMFSRGMTWMVIGSGTLLAIFISIVNVLLGKPVERSLEDSDEDDDESDELAISDEVATPADKMPANVGYK
jgi:hypothetical protein